MEDSTMTAVNTQVETETTQTAPAENQTTEGVSQQEDKYVPYGRFKEVNEGLKAERERYARLEQEINSLKSTVGKPAQEEDPSSQLVRDALGKLDYAPRSEIMKEVQTLLNQKEADLSLDKEMSRLEAEYKDLGFDRKSVVEFANTNGIFDPEAAFLKMKKAEVIDYHIKQATTKSKGVKSENSDGSGTTNIGTTDQDLLNATKSGDKNAWLTYLKRH